MALLSTRVRPEYFSIFFFTYFQALRIHCKQIWDDYLFTPFQFKTRNINSAVISFDVSYKEYGAALTQYVLAVCLSLYVTVTKLGEDHFVLRLEG